MFTVGVGDVVGTAARGWVTAAGSWVTAVGGWETAVGGWGTADRFGVGGWGTRLENDDGAATADTIGTVLGGWGIVCV